MRIFVIGILAFVLMAASPVYYITRTEGDGTVVHATVTGKDVVLWDSRGAKVFLKDTFGNYDPATNTRTVSGHSGGYLYKALVLIERGNRTGEKVRLTCERGCISSPTLFLSAKNVCIGRKGWFGFHGPTESILGLKRSESLMDVVTNAYPKGIRSIYRSKWSKRYGMGFYKITAKELKSLVPSLPYCK